VSTPPRRSKPSGRGTPKPSRGANIPTGGSADRRGRGTPRKPAETGSQQRSAQRDRPRPDTDRRPRAPRLPPDIDPRDLDRRTRAGLRSLPVDLADKIASHLVAAGQLLDDDPVAARSHVEYARRLAPRLSVTREASGVVAYHNGDYVTALAELRAVRRMTGDPTYLPIMADSERGLGRPERALALSRDPDAKLLAPAERVELAIVASGARRDRGETKAAIVALRGPDLDRADVQPWTARLWYAYATALADAGRTAEARQWFESVVSIDEHEETDAEEQLAALDTTGTTTPTG